MKAVLLSALVFPGAGHALLKKYVASAVLAGVSFVALYYLVTKTVARAMQVVDKIQSGEISPDFVTITELVTKQSTGPDAQMQNVASMVILVCWLIGIVDSYRVGRKNK